MGGRLHSICRKRLPRRRDLKSMVESGRLEEAPNRLPRDVDRGLNTSVLSGVEAEEGVVVCPMIIIFVVCVCCTTRLSNAVH